MKKELTPTPSMPVAAWLRIRPLMLGDDWDEYDFSANEQPGFTAALVRQSDAQALLDAKESENVALKAANLKLEALCDATYVAQGADAYNHACSEMQAWQAKRRKAAKEVGTEGSLCDGIAWLYIRLAELEKAMALAAREGRDVR